VPLIPLSLWKYIKADFDASSEGPNCGSFSESGSEKDPSEIIPVMRRRRSVAGESTKVSDRRLLANTSGPTK
jgi:hypothetical protein